MFSLGSPATAAFSRTMFLLNSAKHTTARFSTNIHCHRQPPWLMLPPTFDSGKNMVHNFYVLGENQVMTMSLGNGDEDEDEYQDENEEDEEDEEDEDEDELVMLWPDHNCKALGSSHGWLTFLHTQTNHVLLYDPVLTFHLQFPPLPGAGGHITSVTVDPSPNDLSHFRAVATFGPHNRLAFCAPISLDDNRKVKWVPLGLGSGYASVVYSKQRGLFFCCTKAGLQAWDLRDPLIPEMTPLPLSLDNKSNYQISSEQVRHYDFLAVAKPSGDLFHVRRFVAARSGPRGYGGPSLGFDHGAPYRTLGFDIHRYDPNTGSLVYMDSSLDGLVLFVGSNNGLAIPADQYPELMPDSVYYTEPPEWIDWSYGGHDVGIFNNRDKTFSPCFYPVDVQSKRRVSGLKWFTPSPISRRTFLVQNNDGSMTITPKLPK
ncbi:Unknown protein [Striga hermonthica]|uniref:KIB1-4 beta-propeller domain-containing protein n=1 Tax=Striga hermonthica TaxID=68872 RepID=A0A9N7RBL4_STRHE|nr:Unknown protein [Striga hermonthica]